MIFRKKIAAFLLFGCIFCHYPAIFGQKIGAPDSLKMRIASPDSNRIVLNKDSASVGKDSVPVKKKFVPKPKTALLFSIAPGGGQIYNRKLWYIKAPIVYGALGFGVWRVITVNSSYRELKTSFYEKVNKLPLTYPRYNNVDESRLKQARNNAFASLQRAYIVAGIIYLLQSAEAFTSAHLMNFDISDDLSMRLKPSFETLPTGGGVMGIGVSMRF